MIEHLGGCAYTHTWYIYTYMQQHSHIIHAEDVAYGSASVSAEVEKRVHSSINKIIRSTYIQHTPGTRHVSFPWEDISRKCHRRAI